MIEIHQHNYNSTYTPNIQCNHKNIFCLSMRISHAVGGVHRNSSPWTFVAQSTADYAIARPSLQQKVPSHFYTHVHAVG